MYNDYFEVTIPVQLILEKKLTSLYFILDQIKHIEGFGSYNVQVYEYLYRCNGTSYNLQLRYLYINVHIVSRESLENLGINHIFARKLLQFASAVQKNLKRSLIR